MAQHDALQLDFVDEAIWEERTDRAIHHSHGQDFLLAWGAFALLEAAWVLTGGGGALAVIAGKREEIDASARVGADGGAQDDGVAVTGDDCSVGELGNLASFESQRTAADFTFNNDMLLGTGHLLHSSF